MKQLDLKNVELPSEGKGKLPPGGYVCYIVKVQDVPEKEYIKVDYDILEGEHKDRYAQLQEAKNFWGGNFIRSYTDKSLPFFKAFITAIENSNKGFVWQNNEQALVSKQIGLVIGYEEYIKKDGSIAERPCVDFIRSVESIRKGDFKIPELKKIKVKPSAMDGFAKTEDVPVWGK